MSRKDNAGSRRVMKHADYSHAEPVIYIEKDYITSLAFTLKDKYGIKYVPALNIIGNYLCGTKMDFSEFHQAHRYDLTYEQAKVAFPDILDVYLDRLHEATGLNKHYVVSVLSTPESALHKKDMASRYEVETGLLACVKQDCFADFVKQRKADLECIVNLCNDLDGVLLDDSPWVKQNKQDLLTEVKEMVAKLRKGAIAGKHRDRVVKWCKDQIQTTLNRPV